MVKKTLERKMKIIYLCLTIALLSGCMTIYRVTPCLNVTVVEQTKGEKLEGVEIYRKPADNEKIFLLGKTNSNGTFSIKGKKKITVAIPPGDPVFMGNFIFRKDGFEDAEYPYFISTSDVFISSTCPVIDEVIKLKRKPIAR